MADQSRDDRVYVRYDILECGMLWRPSGPLPERVGPALITNISIGGVQFRTKGCIESAEDLLLQLGSDDGPVFIPGRVRYLANGNANGMQTFGFNFIPKNVKDKEAIARYVMAIRDRVCAFA